MTEFHHERCIQSGAYQNGYWIIAVAKAGIEEGVDKIGLSSIVAPSGEIVARSTTVQDELVVYICDLDAKRDYKTDAFFIVNGFASSIPETE